MHRRSRHLNPASAGMGLVLDSRFITGLNAGDTVSNWKDRSSNANNATGATNLPTYQTNRQGGAPALVFNSTLSTRLSSLAPVFRGTNARTMVVVYKSTATGSFANGIAGQGGLSTTGSIFNIQAINFFGVVGDPFVNCIGADTQNNKSTPDNLWKIGSGIYDGTTLFTRKNGVEIDSVVRSLSTVFTPLTIGASQASTSTVQNFLSGDIGLILAGQISYSLPLVRRLEHSAAFSFKLPCS